MVSFDMGIVSEVQSVTTHPDGEEVTVKVVGPTNIPMAVKSTRARARALVESGVVDSSADTMSDALFEQDLHRLTAITGDPIVRTESDFIQDLTPGGLLDQFSIGELEAVLFNVVVRGD